MVQRKFGSGTHCPGENQGRLWPSHLKFSLLSRARGPLVLILSTLVR